jgi:hypothetical protein
LTVKSLRFGAALSASDVAIRTKALANRSMTSMSTVSPRDRAVKRRLTASD